MPISPAVLIEPKIAEAVATQQYIADGVTAIIDKFTATNNGGAAVTVTVNLVPNGAAAALANTIIDARNIEPGECYTCPELVGHVLEAQSFITTTASVAGSLTIRASGREITP